MGLERAVSRFVWSELRDLLALAVLVGLCLVGAAVLVQFKLVPPLTFWGLSKDLDFYLVFQILFSGLIFLVTRDKIKALRQEIRELRGEIKKLRGDT